MSLSLHLLKAASDALARSQTCVLVTVIEVKGSTPRGVGTSMLVFPSSIVDTIGGGRLEYEAMRTARNILNGSEPTTNHQTQQRYPLGDSLGQCCGGAVTLMFEHLNSESIVWVDEALNCLHRRTHFERIAAPGIVYVATPANAHLLLFGAGHVGRALVSVLADAPISIHWVDERASEFPHDVPANALVEVTDLPEVILENAPAGSAVLITTHRHDLDFKLVESALERGSLAYIGMIGSLSKRKRFERQWMSRGRAGNALPDLICPIGHEGPAGKEPAVVAIGVACEILKKLKPA